LRVEKPWGFEVEVKATDRYSVWRLHISKGQETSLHCHSFKDVFLSVMSGYLLVERATGVTVLAIGGVMLIERGEYHRLRAPQDGDVIVHELEWPNNREDITRKEDKYGRCV
jgi:mannose-6-phosphate isomerase-like protein (cupin superfamily)